jgi:hypothetical protein
VGKIVCAIGSAWPSRVDDFAHAPRALSARCPLYAFFPSFDHFIGERQGNERFDAQNKFKLVSLFDSSHLRHSGL